MQMDNPSLTQAAILDSSILIVDDARTLREMLSHLCQAEGFTNIREAKNGREALEQIEASQPDLVFLDLYMPEMDGIEVCDTLNERGLMQDIAIVVVSSTEKTVLKDRLFLAGVMDVIQKPFDAIEVTMRARAHLERILLRRQQMEEYHRISTELQEAIALQSLLTPETQELQAIASHMGLDIAYHYEPASELGGDYVLVERRSNHEVLITLVDVVGHGISAGLYAFSIHGLFIQEARTNRYPAHILAAVNQRLSHYMPTGKFATAFCGLLDTEKGVFYYAGAGFPRPALLSNQESLWLDSAGLPLGIASDTSYSMNMIDVQEGDLLFFYSDALIETPDNQGNIIEEKELVDILHHNKQVSAASILECVNRRLLAQRSDPLRDDLSLLLVSYRGDSDHCITPSPSPSGRGSG